MSRIQPRSTLRSRRLTRACLRRIFTLLGSPLDTTGDKDEGADGEEYNRALDEQAEGRSII